MIPFLHKFKMSNCIIQIKIGDQIITLDPNTNITAEGGTSLIDALDASKLRSLFANLKGQNIDVSDIIKTEVDPVLAAKGELLYTKALNNSQSKVVTPLSAMINERDLENKQALREYISSLNSTEINNTGDFLNEPSKAYQLSPFTTKEIQKLFFVGTGESRKMFEQLMSLPGMEMTRISVAVVDEMMGDKITKVVGAYITPDNIIQVLIPTTGYIRTLSNDKLVIENFTRNAREQASKVILHELTHAVYSELYNNNNTFKGAIDVLHQQFLDTLRTSSLAKDSTLLNDYKDVHEFIADMFVSKVLKTRLAQIPAVKGVPIKESGSLFDTFVGSITTSLASKDSMFKQVVTILDDNIPTLDLSTSIDEVVERTLEDRKNVFFTEGIDQDAVNAHITPRDQVDTYNYTNAKAFRIQQQFIVRHDVVDNKFTIRDAYYKKSIDSPTASQIDTLQQEDLVKIPWIRYVREDGIEGKWVEVGVVTNNGKDVMKDGKPLTVDIVRNDKGENITTHPSGTIEERTRLVPVVYVNDKKQKVTLAKTTGDKSTEFPTISIPYDLVRGMRRFNGDYINHNEDWNKQISELKVKRSEEIKRLKGDEKAITIRQFDIDIAERMAELSEAKRIQMIENYQQYTFSFKDDEGNTVTNVHESNYLASGFSKKDIDTRLFIPENEAPVYVIEKDKNEKYRSKLNPKIFRTLWDTDSGSTFVTDSEDIAEAVSQGDMIRAAQKIEVEVNGEKFTIQKGDWFPVFQRLPNGIEVSTMKGKGFIVPFNQINAYAKNVSTDSFNQLIARVEETTERFKDKLYEKPNTTEERVKRRKLTKEIVKNNISFKSLQFAAEYNVKEGELEETAILRFNKNREATLKKIIPYETFVKTTRSYIDKTTKEKKIYQSIDLVVAKPTGGLTVINVNNGIVKFEYISFEEKVDDNTYGKELAFVLQDVGAVKDVWAEYLAERESYEALKDVASYINTGTEDKPKFKAAFDFEATPRNYRDVYDFYERVNGKTIQDLIRGDVVAIKMSNPEIQADRYYRKVVNVYEDGTIAVAEYNKEPKVFKSGYMLPAGPYVRMLQTRDLVAIGYKRDTVNADTNKKEARERILERRRILLENATRDAGIDITGEGEYDLNLFKFRTAEQAAKWNSKVKAGKNSYTKYIPLTKAMLRYGDKTEEGQPINEESPLNSVYLDKNFNEVSKANATWVEAWFDGDKLRNTVRGLAAKTSYYNAQNLLIQVRNQKKVHPDFLAEIMPGDWITKRYNDKDGKPALFSQVIDRIENGDIWVINKDLTTSKVNAATLHSIKPSLRNDKYSNFKRSARMKALAKKLTQKPIKSNVQSVDAEYKSPADSQRAIFEIGERLKTLNPNVVINYLNPSDLKYVNSVTGHNYTNARAFVLNGEVNINLGKASISDVIHEYAHLFLHSLKYENSDMYNNIIDTTKSNPFYERVANDYLHLEGEDLHEEVFVTVLGEYLNGTLKEKYEDWWTKNDLAMDFATYTKSKLSEVMGRQIDSIYDLNPDEVLTMNFEDVINLIGDEIMKNRIDNIYDRSLAFKRDISKLKSDLMKSNQLTMQCYG